MGTPMAAHTARPCRMEKEMDISVGEAGPQEIDPIR